MESKIEKLLGENRGKSRKVLSTPVIKLNQRNLQSDILPYLHVCSYSLLFVSCPTKQYRDCTESAMKIGPKSCDRWSYSE